LDEGDGQRGVRRHVGGHQPDGLRARGAERALHLRDIGGDEVHAEALRHRMQGGSGDAGGGAGGGYGRGRRGNGPLPRRSCRLVLRPARVGGGNGAHASTLSRQLLAMLSAMAAKTLTVVDMSVAEMLSSTSARSERARSSTSS